MDAGEHCRKLERMYAAAPCNAYYAPRIKIAHARAELIIPVQPQFFHSAGAAHGVLYFKALDDAAFFAANSLVKDRFALTVSFHLHLLRPVASGSIRAVGEVVQYTRRLIVAESRVFNDASDEIARGSGTFARSRIALTPEVGYR
jgi:uncharacterized protein (TIGR00369 family)